jgi:hypothetical protein
MEQHPVHRITAWSARPEDERPWCGADHWRRTIFAQWVTCPQCLNLQPPLRPAAGVAASLTHP